jgi:CysZ protein
MIMEPFTGANYFFRGFGIAFMPKIRRFIYIPLIVNILLFAGGLWYSFAKFDELIDWITPDWLSDMPDWLGWLETGITWILFPIFAIVVFVVVFYTFSLIANLIAAPFNGMLAEAVEKKLTGQEVGNPFDFRVMLRTLIPMMFDEVKKLLYFVLWAIPLLLLFLVPVVNIAASLVWILFSAWMLSLEYMDFPMGNHNLRFKAIRKRVTSQRFMSLGFGGAVLVGTMIPVFNFIVMPVAVCGATALWVDKYRSDNERLAGKNVVSEE